MEKPDKKIRNGIKSRIIFVLFIFLSSCVFADAFTDILQDLAMQTACIGQYSATQAGGGWYDDPNDCYTPQMLAQRFAKMSGKRTRTQTFYGICFDYAQEAWNDIKAYQQSYNKAGMKNSQWYIATDGNAQNSIILYDPTTREKATRVSNGVYIKENSRYAVTPHVNSRGIPAVNHAWLWVQHENGTWFWIDPTWTDNLGYVVWGYVKDGREIQCAPAQKYCVNSAPQTLVQLPSEATKKPVHVATPKPQNTQPQQPPSPPTALPSTIQPPSQPSNDTQKTKRRPSEHLGIFGYIEPNSENVGWGAEFALIGLLPSQLFFAEIEIGEAPGELSIDAENSDARGSAFEFYPVTVGATISLGFIYPYIKGSIGYFYASEDASGMCAECKIGADVKIKSFSVGGYYCFKKYGDIDFYSGYGIRAGFIL